MRRIGMLTSGGDCQALNATMRGVAKVLYNKLDDVEILGFMDGYRGLMHNDYRVMRPSDFSGILTMGGTILGSSRQPFKKMRVIEADGLDKVAAMKKTYRELGLECLVILGGNGSQKTANLLTEEGMNVVSLPKTIDNDCIHTTAASHSRVFIVEVMGHKVGWLTLHAGIAGGADIILLPEIPYDLDCVLAAIERRHKAGKRFSILAVAEGAISKEDAQLSKKEYNKKIASSPYPSISYELGAKIEEAIGREVRITVPGHTQRGGGPDPYDRFISSRLGAAAGRLVVERKYGRMVAFDGFEVVNVSLNSVAGKLKYVDPKGAAIQEAKDMGICFGDE